MNLCNLMKFRRHLLFGFSITARLIINHFAGFSALVTIPAKLEIFKNTFYFSGTVLYNSLPNEIRKVDSYRKFKECIKTHFS